MPTSHGYPRNLMFSLAWLIGVGIVAGAAGIGFGIWYSQRSGAAKRVIELEEQLSSAQQAHEAYRQEVFGQFSDTAEKFQTLNESYVDLHQQLAKSASVLCGDLATVPLLEGTLASALTDDSGDHAPTEDLQQATDQQLDRERETERNLERDLELHRRQYVEKAAGRGLEEDADLLKALGEPSESILVSDEDIVVAEVPTLNDLLGPLDEGDPEVRTAATQTSAHAPTSESDRDSDVREAG